jgi:hypothetical protein
MISTNVTNNELELDETVKLNASGSETNASSIEEYKWDITSSSGYEFTTSNPTKDYSFSSTGTYQVSVTVNDTNDKEDTASVQVNVVEPISDPHSTSADCSSITFEEAGTAAEPYKVSNDYELQCMSKDKDGEYELTQNINASGTQNWNGFDNAKGFKPIETFSGGLNGKGYEIHGLHIDRPTEDTVGMIGRYDNTGSEIRNIGLVDIDVTGNQRTGGLIGYYADSSSSFKVVRTYSKGSVTGGDYVGGLIGDMKEGRVKLSSTEGTVDGVNYVGGLVGTMSNYDAYVTKSYSLSDVNSGESDVGGLVGRSADYDQKIADSYYGGTIDTSFSGDTISAVIGGIRRDPTTSDLYYDESGAPSSPGVGTAVSHSQITGGTAAGMSGLDFTNTWETTSSYPDHQWKD